jgi:DNA sulfur modification protein DndD
MFIKNITLENFRQYKNKHTIDFGTSQDKNVTVILGENTSGKTTLLQAFNWVLYGKANFKTKDFLLNLELAQDLKLYESKYVKVKLVLIHNSTEYTIERSQEYKKTSVDVIAMQAEQSITYKDKDGQTKFIDSHDLEDTVNKIIPEELTSYFFFDGERIENLGRNEKKGKEDLARAVKTVLGLEALNNAVEHLSVGHKHSVIGRFRESLDLSGNAELNTAQKNKSDLLDQKKSIEEQITSNLTSVEYFQNQVEKNEKILKENQEIKEIQLRRKHNEESITTTRKLNNEIFKGIKKEFNEKFMYFGTKLISKSQEILEKQKMHDKGIPEMHGDSIEFLIKRGKCVCGTVINSNEDAINHLKLEQSYLPPQSLGTLINNFRNDASLHLSPSNNLKESFITQYKKFRENENEISILHEKNDEISDDISSFQDIGEVEKENKLFKEKINEYNKQRESLKERLGSIDQQINDIVKKITEFSSADEKNKHISEYIKYAQVVNDILKSSYDKNEKEFRGKLEEKVNEIFKKMYHGSRSIKINEKYVYQLDTPNINQGFSNKADESKGLEIVTSFSFICGIVKLARENINRIDNSLELTSEPYPLVMDGPFSNADEKHIENIAKIMPEVAEQILIFVMHKDWNHAEKVLKNRIAKTYELKKQSETSTVLKEC